MSERGCAVVTGGGGAIGRAVAHALAAAGYGIAVLDASAEAAADTVGALEAPALARAVDVRDAAAVDAAVLEAEEQLGPIAAAVTCAGVIETEPLLELAPDVWQRTLDVNLNGTFFTFQAVGRRMVASGTKGALVGISSISARGPRPSNPAYAASKLGVISVVRSTAAALAASGIRVNAVVPGVIDTEMTQHLHAQRAHAAGITVDESLARMVETIPLGVVGTPAMVADVVAFLVSDAARYVTGQSLNVCGGIEMN
jgi:NAD(P)-dependent dehydrogenase (short-subunit alcohol dehydrogenase family)